MFRLLFWAVFIASTVAGIVVSCVPTAAAARVQLEKTYQADFCREVGRVEVVLPDATRVDCLTNGNTLDSVGYAVEMDFADKWAEAIGQALYYADQTRMLAGIAVIMESVKDCRYLPRLNAVASKFSIKVWQVGPYANKC